MFLSSSFVTTFTRFVTSLDDALGFSESTRKFSTTSATTGFVSTSLFSSATASTALVDYLAGLGQPGDWNTGVGGGLLYRNDSFKMMLCYAYGIDAIRSHGRGANSIGILMQLDLAKAKAKMFSPTSPNMWQGMQRFFGVFKD